MPYFFCHSFEHLFRLWENILASNISSLTILKSSFSACFRQQKSHELNDSPAILPHLFHDTIPQTVEKNWRGHFWHYATSNGVIQHCFEASAVAWLLFPIRVVNNFGPPSRSPFLLPLELLGGMSINTSCRALNFHKNVVKFVDLLVSRIKIALTILFIASRSRLRIETLYKAKRPSSIRWESTELENQCP